MVRDFRYQGCVFYTLPFHNLLLKIRTGCFMADKMLTIEFGNIF